MTPEQALKLASLDDEEYLIQLVNYGPYVDGDRAYVYDKDDQWMIETETYTNVPLLKVDVSQIRVSKIIYDWHEQNLED